MNKEIDLEARLLINFRSKVEDRLLDVRQVFSLHKEGGDCPTTVVDFDLEDKKPFFIRPYHATDQQKVEIDKYLNKMRLMGIIEEGLSDYTSSIMLISKRGTKDKRCVADLRFLNRKN